jgi:DNA-binding beta-propeller fold protein YncE
MMQRVFIRVACAALCALTAPALAQQELGQQLVVTYTALGMSPSLDGSIVDVGSDGTNRVWTVAPGRVSAALGSARVPLFPIAVADTPLAAAARFRSVAFAVPSGNVADGEHFYLGSSAGIAWGRVTSTIEHKSPPLVVAPTSGSTFPAGEDPNQTNQIATDGSDWLWAASSGGLVLWDLSETDPVLEDIYLDGSGDGAISAVAVAPSGDAVAVESERLWLVDVLGAETLIYELGAGVIRGIAFDAAGSLWAATTATVSGFPQLLKFEADAASGGFAPVPKSFPLNPFVGTGGGAPAGFAPTGIAVDPITGRVWVTTESNQGPMNSAYFQALADPSGDLQTDPAGNGWGVVTSIFDRFTVVHADTAGNAWFGMAGAGASGEALNGYVVRLLTLDKSRYLGTDTGVATLFDLTLAGAGTAPLSIAVAGESRAFTPPEEAAEPGTFVQTFSIAPSDEAGGSGEEFLASSSADDVPVQALYAFTDANDQPRELTATASWANIVSFEDDLIVGGPCFLGILGQ